MEFHKLYNFFTDHLPVGVKVQDTKFVTLNCLNKHYVKYINEYNNQGYKNSEITDLHSQFISDNILDTREIKAFKYIQYLLNKNYVCLLQEVSYPLLMKLKEFFFVITEFKECKNYNVIVFNTMINYDARFVNFDKSDYYFIHCQTNQFNIINVHLPWYDYHVKNELFKNPAIKQLIKYVQLLEKNKPIIIGGDFNTNLDQILFPNATIYTPYNTHIDANFIHPNKKVAKFDGFILIDAKATLLQNELPLINDLVQLLKNVKTRKVHLLFKSKV